MIEKLKRLKKAEKVWSAKASVVARLRATEEDFEAIAAAEREWVEAWQDAVWNMPLHPESPEVFGSVSVDIPKEPVNPYLCRGALPASMNRGEVGRPNWEYDVIRIGVHSAEITSVLDKKGEEGWECFSSVVVNNIIQFHMKRLKYETSH